MKKITISVRGFISALFLFLALLTIGYGVSVRIVMSPGETLLAWIFMGMALIAILKLDEFLTLLIQWAKAYWELFQLRKEVEKLDKRFSSWGKEGVKKSLQKCK
jgi:hypothetical protein